MSSDRSTERGIATLPVFGERLPGREYGWPRRAVLKAIGTGALATMASGTAAATGANGNGRSMGRFGLGEMGTLGGGRVATFALPDRHGRTGALGVFITADTLETLPEEPQMLHLHFPRTPGTNFTYLGLDWTPMGHQPVEIYGLPHFDIHFYLMEEDDVEAIGPGVAEYTIPDAQMPPGYVTADALGAPREIVPGMGEHLVSPMAREFQGERFTHTLVWGAYNPDGGDEGELTFVEPMVTTEYLEGKPRDVRAPISTPEEFAASGYYPTEYAIRYLDTVDAYLVTLESFEWFPGVE